MSQLGVDQTDHVTPRFEGSRQILGPSNPRQGGHFVRRNKIANLLQNVQLRPCWVDFLFFHPCLVAGQQGQSNTFFSKPGGWLCAAFYLQSLGAYKPFHNIESWDDKFSSGEFENSK